MKIKEIINKILWKINLRISKPFPRAFQKYNLMGSDKNLIGVEVGVYEGDNALSLLKRSSIKKLYLVDPYESYTSLFYPKGFSGERLEVIEATAKAKLFPFDNKVIWIKETSDKALSKIPKNLDFVYIDGNHSYKYVKKDIENYYSKLKEGGVLSGHDFTMTPSNVPNESGVIEAVVEFAIKNNLKFRVEDSDWWIIKLPL